MLTVVRSAFGVLIVFRILTWKYSFSLCLLFNYNGLLRNFLNIVFYWLLFNICNLFIFNCLLVLLLSLFFLLLFTWPALSLFLLWLIFNRLGFWDKILKFGLLIMLVDHSCNILHNFMKFARFSFSHQWIVEHQFRRVQILINSLNWKTHIILFALCTFFRLLR